MGQTIDNLLRKSTARFTSRYQSTTPYATTHTLRHVIARECLRQNCHYKGLPPQSTRKNRLTDSEYGRTYQLGCSTFPVNRALSQTHGVTRIDSKALEMEPKEETQTLFEGLRCEANVTSNHSHGKLAIDLDGCRNDWALWVEILNFRQRIDGFKGVHDVWNGMMKRQCILPISGGDAAVLWSKLIFSCISDPEEEELTKLLNEIVQYAIVAKLRHKTTYPNLYKLVIGRWLHIRPRQAKKWHFLLIKSDLAPCNMLQEIIHDAVSMSGGEESMKDRFGFFSKVYEAQKRRDMYDYVLPYVLEHCNETVALRWHRLFMKHDDKPSIAIRMRPEIQRLFSLHGAYTDASIASPPILSLNKIITGTSPASPLLGTSMTALIGHAHGIKAKEISDTLAARLFATNSFSLDMIIRGLVLFGVGKLGPLSLQELAVRVLATGSISELKTRLSELREAGLNISGNLFCLTLLKLVDTGQVGLLRTFLARDLHPEEYDTPERQEALLCQQLDQGCWHEAHLTMMVLSLAGIELTGRSLNLLMQHHVRRGEWSATMDIMRQIQLQNVSPDEATIQYLLQYVLPARRKAKRPSTKYIRSQPHFHALGFVTNALMHAENINGAVPAHVWREMLKRHGMLSRWNDVDRLVRWLVARFQAVSRSIETVPDDVSYGDVRLADSAGPKTWDDDDRGEDKRVSNGSMSEKYLAIFTREMQQAIFVWGFRTAARRNLLRPLTASTSPPDVQTRMERETYFCEPWAQGLALLMSLNEDGIPIDVRGIRKSFVLRMWLLFGPGRSKLRINQATKDVNKLDLAHYLQHANELCEGKLFPSLCKSLTGLEDQKEQAELMTRLFKSQRHAPQASRYIVNISD